MPKLAALLACGVGVSCGSGLHDADQEQSTTMSVSAAGSRIEFMGATLDLGVGCVESDVDIKLTWHRSISYLGALSSVYDLEVPSPGTLKKDPQIDITTTPERERDPNNVIGFMVPSIGTWVPDTSAAKNQCPASAVCGPVQSQTFDRPDPVNYPGLKTNLLRLAIVTRCGAGFAASCPSGQSCSQAGACQQCPAGSPCP